MTSTFFGLETAKRALATQQAALHTTGHNIANANTPGYTRQRVNFATTNPYPSPGLNRPQIPGQIGTGVKAGDIQRIRDSFTDMQYRTETSKLGYWQSKSEMLSQMENIMNEPSDVGLANTMDQFWNSLQDLAVQPQNDGARRVVRERGIALANTFNYISNSLKSIQVDYRKEIDASQDKINSLLRQVNSINKQIGSIEPHGYLPNDLYDERDRLVDQLSEMVNIRIEKKPSGGLASANSEGLYDIYLATPTGDILKDSNNKPIRLVDSSIGKATGIHIQYDNRSELDSPVTEIKFFELNENNPGFAGINSELEADNHKNPSYHIDNFQQLNSQGQLKGYIEGYGYQVKTGENDEDTTIYGTYNDMLADLDQMAFTFATHFNLVHSAGWSLNEIQGGEESEEFGDFFAFGKTIDENNIRGAASSLSVAQHIIDDVQNIAAAAEGNVLAGVMNRSGELPGTVGNPTFTGIYDPSKSGIKDENGDVVDWPMSENPINVTLEYNQGENGGEWEFTFETKDGTGNIIKATGTTDEKTAEFFGIEFDMSNIVFPEEIPTDIENKWKLTFQPEGKKSEDESFVGDGSNALALADVKDAMINYGGTTTNVLSFYQGMIGKLGDNASEANRMTNTAVVLKDSVEQRRMSESSVSLDEEMTNMIQFQHAYNAAARNITMIDEMLDKIINGMGVVGR